MTVTIVETRTQARAITGGVDTHAEVHVAAALSYQPRTSILTDTSTTNSGPMSIDLAHPKVDTSAQPHVPHCIADHE